MNLALLSFFATSRTPRRPIDEVLRLCVRAPAVCSVFPLVGPLPSTASADGSGPSLFGGFSGTMGPSDFPPACMSDVRLLAFSDRPTAPSAMGADGISRFPRKEFPRMHRVFDSAGLEHDSRIAPCPMLPSAPINSVGVPEGLISELNGWPACTPVNASPVALRRPTHDSGPVWLARPSPCDSFIHNSLPVFTGATNRSPRSPQHGLILGVCRVLVFSSRAISRTFFIHY